MARPRTISGEITQCDTPEWAPLRYVVGDELAADFMWMCELRLADGRELQLYKHIYTRRSVHLHASGEAFAYVPRGRYRSVPAADVLTEVFETLPGLYGVTEDQIARSWTAVDRLREIDERAAG
jgi:hypothetical protein